jgi:hypothetical protein
VLLSQADMNKTGGDKDGIADPSQINLGGTLMDSFRNPVNKLSAQQRLLIRG